MATKGRAPKMIAGYIQADRLYTLAEFGRRLGLGVRALRAARRSGLPVRHIGKKPVVIGRDVLQFVEDGGNG